MAWLRRIFGAACMGLIWAAVWAAAGALIGIVDASGSLKKLWLGPPIGVHPGFVGGVVFAIVLGIAAGPRRFAELSFLAVVACGAIVGMGLGVLPLAINEPPRGVPLWLVAIAVIGSMTFMGALSAAGVRAVAGRARARS